MTPKSRLLARGAIQNYRAEILEGVASYVEQLELHENASSEEVRERIVRLIRDAK